MEGHWQEVAGVEAGRLGFWAAQVVEGWQWLQRVVVGLRQGCQALVGRHWSG